MGEGEKVPESMTEVALELGADLTVEDKKGKKHKFPIENLVEAEDHARKVDENMQYNPETSEPLGKVEE
jgi:hypothetical protein